MDVGRTPDIFYVVNLMVPPSGEGLSEIVECRWSAAITYGQVDYTCNWESDWLGSQ